MQELVSRMSSDDILGLILGTLTFLAGMIVWLSLQWRMYRRTELEFSLKQEMLQRGMSAEEIDRVLKSPGRTTHQERVELADVRRNLRNLLNQ